MRALFLTRYGPLGASSRQRCFLYLGAFAAAGIAAEVCPLLGDDYVRRLYAGRAVNIAAVLRAYASRLLALLRASRYDLAWIEKEALPWLSAGAELALLKLAGAAIVVDYDDAVFHRYDQHRNRFVRRALRDKIDRVMRAADLVTVGNAYVGERAKAAGARAVAEIPTVVDLRRYPERRSLPARRDGPFTIGWIGSPATSAYLDRLHPVLTELATRLPLRIILIGAASGTLAGLPVEHVAWSPETEAAELARCDAGVMPLPDLPWERGKCGYKLIQYMASALPVVASPVGANRDIVVAGETGFVADTNAEWVASLSRLAQDPELRRRMGTAGRWRAGERYSLEVTAPQLIELLFKVAPTMPTRRRAAAMRLHLPSQRRPRVSP
ncbi:MAG TPA: glycosyltransferase family 4 protein [Stellaceae bacterium]|nr:glycosyltransferase family 4 protein [Stellaceae bacterium]